MFRATALGAVTTALLTSLALPAGAAPSFTIANNPASSDGADGRVAAIAAGGGYVYIGGSFTHVGGQSHAGLARLNATTGVVSPWRADVGGGDVRSLALSSDGTVLYVGGLFTSVDGALRENIAAVSTSTGTVVSSFDPGANRPVEALATTSSAVYVGGRFHTIAGQPLINLAALDPTSGAAIPGFQPDPNDHVSTLQVANGVLYAGGYFNVVGGLSRPHLASVSLTTGGPTAWHPQLTCPVLDLAVTSTDVYLACGGGKLKGNRVVDLAVGTAAQKWLAQTDGNVHTVTLLGGYVFAGGHFGHVQGEVRHHAVQLSAATGAVQPNWNPRFNTALGVFAMRATTSNLWVGGDFTLVNGKPQPHDARFVYS